MSNEKEERDAVRNDVRPIEQEKQFLHLAECNQQGQCLRWEGGREKNEMEENMGIGTSKIEFSLKLMYDMLPTPVSLMRWKISEKISVSAGRMEL